MPWFKVDDQLYSHPKWVGASDAAKALWTTAGSWCAAQPDDGRVPAHMLTVLGARPKAARELVERGLWDEDPDGNGWRFHDWLEFQPSAEEIEERRRRDREKKRRQRSVGMSSRNDNGTFAGRASPPVSPGDTQRDSPGESPPTPEGSPSVARPDPSPITSSPPPTNGGTRPAEDEEEPDQQPPDLACAVATVLADQQPPGSIRTSRHGWIRAAAADVGAREAWDRDTRWLTAEHPELEQHQVVLALASRHADGRWPSWITPPVTRPDVWAGLPGEPDEVASAVRHLQPVEDLDR